MFVFFSRVKKIIQHHKFDPLREDGGDGRHDIALVILYPHRDGKVARFNHDVAPICVPQPDYPLHKLYENHCEIAGWGMTEYNNTSSYPDSVRAAREVTIKRERKRILAVINVART